jgi:small subunit ribosomal protein S9
MVKSTTINAVGKRKRAIARVYMKPGTGVITVNSLPYEEYFGRETLNMILKQGLDLLGLADKFDVKIIVNGGGKSGQAGAIRHGISRALNIFNKDEYRVPLKKAGFLTRDDREVERKKYGLHKARKRPQYSKR